jgi:hypothetical protein
MIMISYSDMKEQIKVRKQNVLTPNQKLGLSALATAFGAVTLPPVAIEVARQITTEHQMSFALLGLGLFAFASFIAGINSTSLRQR